MSRVSLRTAVTPAPTDAPRRYDWGYIRNIALQHKPDLVIAHVVAVLATLASVPLPLLMPILVDEVLLDQPGRAVGIMDEVFPSDWHGPVLYITTVLLVTLVLRACALILNVVQARQFTRISKDIIFRMRRELLGRLQRISMAEYESLGSGAVATHFVTDLDTVDEFVGSTVSRLLIAVLTIFGTAIVLIWIHWPLALFILLVNPIVILFTRMLGKHVKELKKRENTAFEAFQHALTETLDAIQQIRASNRERHYLLQLTDRARAVKDHAVAFAWKSDAANRSSFMVFLFGFDIFRAVSMLMVVFSDLTIGQMFAVFGYLWFMMSPVQELLNMQYAYYGAKGAMDRINRLADLHQEPRYPHIQNPFEDKKTVGIRIDKVEFAYGDGPNVLNEVSLDIAPREKVALVGASGGGKSTLVQVLLGLYPPKAGTVYFDGVPVTRIGLDVVREHVATVLQHPALLNDTVRANLTLGEDEPEEKLWRALDIAQLREVVESMDAGLDTVVGRQGVRLSGGQRQRLAIARMVLADPKVVILDEATSSLDTETEHRLHTALAAFLDDRTTLIVAHRLSAVKQADRVYVFEDGHIAEQGEHEELITQNGLYAKLYGEYQH